MRRLILVSPQKHKQKTGIISSIAVSLVLVIFALLLIYNKQFIIDQITVWQYSPTSEINALVVRGGMNDKGKFLYLASQPKLDGTQNFNKECDRLEYDTSILGCYSNFRIYIYDVTDTKLDGIREVTAIHETLHAIYARMSTTEKTTVNSLIEAEYNKIKGNTDFAELMAFYARAEPGQRDNELYSIIGTEIANVSPDLEAHYDKYFSNRQKVVDLNTKYSSVFKTLKNQADKLLSQIDELKNSISTRTAQYNADAQKLSHAISDFNVRAASGDFTSLLQFNNERSILTSRTVELDATRNSISKDISTSNTLLDEYNSLASESKKLYNMIDSTLSPAPSV